MWVVCSAFKIQACQKVRHKKSIEINFTIEKGIKRDSSTSVEVNGVQAVTLTEQNTSLSRDLFTGCLNQHVTLGISRILRTNIRPTAISEIKLWQNNKLV